MYDHIGALVLLLAAAIMLAAGGVPSARTGHNVLPDFDSEAARRYHESNQFGR
jgi:hypothetical protein